MPTLAGKEVGNTGLGLMRKSLASFSKLILKAD